MRGTEERDAFRTETSLRESHLRGQWGSRETETDTPTQFPWGREVTWRSVNGREEGCEGPKLRVK